ncbi:MAG: hypothetical protein GXX82_08890 [Syntrophorhabdus sp.]|jgi:hypothetical protein|nr:hypothetical protein [Syntrophorhabdus sp.]
MFITLARVWRLLFVGVFAVAFGVSSVHAMGDLGIVVETLTDPGKEMHCPVCGRAINPGVVHTDAPVIIREKLKTALTERNIGYSDGMKPDQPYIHVLVYRFQERKGGNFAVEKPASVAFHMHLMKNRMVGKIFAYSEEQKALTQNLLTVGKFFRRGARWVTAEELAGEGINAGLDELVEPKETTEPAE